MGRLGGGALKCSHTATKEQLRDEGNVRSIEEAQEPLTDARESMGTTVSMVPPVVTTKDAGRSARVLLKNRVGLT